MTLEILFGNLGNSGQVEERVRLFDKFRQPRALMTQIVYSDADEWNQDGDIHALPLAVSAGSRS
jgi:hypothetical protein